MINFWLINAFFVTGFFLYHLKTSENHRISDFFKGVQKEISGMKWVNSSIHIQVVAGLSSYYHMCCIINVFKDRIVNVCTIEKYSLILSHSCVYTIEQDSHKTRLSKSLKFIRKDEAKLSLENLFSDELFGKRVSLLYLKHEISVSISMFGFFISSVLQEK